MSLPQSLTELDQRVGDSDAYCITLGRRDGGMWVANARADGTGWTCGPEKPTIAEAIHAVLNMRTPCWGKPEDPPAGFSCASLHSSTDFTEPTKPASPKAVDPLLDLLG